MGRSVIVRLPSSISNGMISGKITGVIIPSWALSLILWETRLVLQNGSHQVCPGNHHLLSHSLFDATNASLLVSPFSYDMGKTHATFTTR